ncbi:hypothetical protein SDJN02_13937 [Cucurbita argyrosperma subsp. argyrosperma]|nr:hypothetical protein SDJN02_13937 [Cucurbita argyrosperma subsp. argyrosperma]
MPRNMNGSRHEGGEDESGMLWKLPVLKSSRIGRLGPAFGLGVGCGVGFGIGLVGGFLLQLGFGVLVSGCGLGLGFGYAIEELLLFCHQETFLDFHFYFISRDEIGALVDELALNTKKLIRVTAQEIDKWKR